MATGNKVKLLRAERVLVSDENRLEPKEFRLKSSPTSLRRNYKSYMRTTNPARNYLARMPSDVIAHMARFLPFKTVFNLYTVNTTLKGYRGKVILNAERIYVPIDNVLRYFSTPTYYNLSTLLLDTNSGHPLVLPSRVAGGLHALELINLNEDRPKKKPSYTEGFFSMLRQCTALTKLNLYASQQNFTFRDLEFLQYAPQLKVLILEHCDESFSLKGIVHCTQLQELKLLDCRGITSLTPLTECTTVESLNLSNCINLYSLKAVESLHSMRNFSSTSGYITNFSPLNSCLNLETLSIRLQGRVHTMEGPTECTKVSNFTLERCNIISLLWLEKYTSLEKVTIDISEELTDITALASSAHTLIELHIRDCPHLLDF